MASIERQCFHSVNRSQFFVGSYLYIISDSKIDINNSTACSINKAWLADKDKTIWRDIVKNVKEEYGMALVLGRTRNRAANVPRVKQVFIRRTLRLVLITICSKKQTTRKRSIPPLSTDALHTTAAKATKKQRSKFSS